jgi:hypothetical protein
MAAYDSAAGGFVSKKTGKRMTGLYSASDFHPSSHATTLAQRRGMMRGRALHKEIELHIKNGAPLRTSRGYSVMQTIKQLYPNVEIVDAEVPVANMKRRVATQVDVLIRTKEIGDIVVEIKYAGPPAKYYMANSRESRGTMHARSQNKFIPRTTHNEHMDQLRSTMSLYACSKKRHRGAQLHGILLVAAEDETLIFKTSHQHIPNTGINAQRGLKSIA